MNFGWGKAAIVAAFLLAGCGQAAPVDPNAGKAEAAAFMAKNAKEEGVQTLPSGLQYKVVQAGPAGGVSPDRARARAAPPPRSSGPPRRSRLRRGRRRRCRAGVRQVP